MLFKCISISVSLDMLTGMGGLRVGGVGWGWRVLRLVREIEMCLLTCDTLYLFYRHDCCDC